MTPYRGTPTYRYKCPVAGCAYTSAESQRCPRHGKPLYDSWPPSVWVVIQRPAYELTYVVGVFSSRERADETAAQWDFTSVEEYALDRIAEWFLSDD